MISRARTSITFYNGLTTIGGPMIEVAYDKSHVLFDLGEVYRPELTLPDEKYPTLLSHHLIGDVPDFYDPLLTGKPLDHVKWKHAAAYISHLHLDHSKAINFLAPEIPLYAGKLTAQLLPVLNEHGDFLLPAAGHDISYTRPIIAANYKEQIKVGKITLEIWPSDHDAYGATGLIITTPDKKIAYTGDIRLHGYHPDWVHQFLQAAKGCDALIIEGTGVSWPEERHEPSSEEFTGPKNEIELINRIVQLEQENPKRQITFNTYPTNVERLLRIIAESPRQVVLHAPRAHLLKRSLDLDTPYYYLPKEKQFADLKSELAIPYQKLLTDDCDYFWQVDSNYDNLQCGGLYIHSNAEPLGDFDPAYGLFMQALVNNQIEFKTLRCSGHADEKELNEIIGEVQPQALIPVHTLHPELEENPFGERILPKRNETITL
ncbi:MULTISPECIES: MBL fold metallo-hydrolase [unclassified Lactobacillus]|uniref:MBL fold metallo-hydrolase n=1 Tax=unclassified Lactobacillus TaxID=2620435 RepID=UPI000EFCF221|nr:MULTISPECIES: MBL fold metallo-hydrolase [unclassified Lactobacillus]RMC25804.1 MBL fold metallo-hydrolase [Lactobacillus sp. ESL0247]RMC29616.1 MBL fold metallo-hydrolase [Lactobacillus sp. ESL0246]RMC33605.1 MBL fold metallo-hydrolase [Lactobacillus sp. ESL0245]